MIIIITVVISSMTIGRISIIVIIVIFLRTLKRKFNDKILEKERIILWFDGIEDRKTIEEEVEHDEEFSFKKKRISIQLRIYSIDKHTPPRPP